MLTVAAALVEAIAVWLYVRGAPWWVVALAAVVGFGVALVGAELLERRAPPSDTSTDG